MKALPNSWLPGAFLFLSIPLVSLTSGCLGAEPGDGCPSESTFIGDTGARHVMEVALPFEPGPVALVVQDEDGDHRAISAGNRLWLDEAGVTLYGLGRDRVWEIDLATGDRKSVPGLRGKTGTMVGAEDALLVTQPEAGLLVRLDLTRPDDPVRIPVGAGPTGVALGPGHRIAYVANAWSRSLSLVETGLGTVEPRARRLLVASRDEGTLRVLDGDGRTVGQIEGLPSHLRGLTALPDGRVVASYSDMVISGDPGVVGDAALVLDEGLAVIDLGSGEVRTHSLRTDEVLSLIAPEVDPALTMARPTGLALLPRDPGALNLKEDVGGREDGLRGPVEVAVALEGFSALVLVAFDDDEPGAAVMRQVIQVEGRPSDIVPGTPGAGEALYVMDSDSTLITAIATSGKVTRRFQLR